MPLELTTPGPGRASGGRRAFGALLVLVLILSGCRGPQLREFLFSALKVVVVLAFALRVLELGLFGGIVLPIRYLLQRRKGFPEGPRNARWSRVFGFLCAGVNLVAALCIGTPELWEDSPFRFNIPWAPPLLTVVGVSCAGVHLLSPQVAAPPESGGEDESAPADA